VFHEGWREVGRINALLISIGSALRLPRIMPSFLRIPYVSIAGFVSIAKFVRNGLRLPHRHGGLCRSVSADFCPGIDQAAFVDGVQSIMRQE
jgi:hypothetical protein